MKELEQKAFALWCNDVPDAFKRSVMTQLFSLVEERPNSTNKSLLTRMRSLSQNVTVSVFNDAVASLKAFGVVATVPSRHNVELYHVNVVKRKLKVWQTYQNQKG